MRFADELRNKCALPDGTVDPECARFIEEEIQHCIQGCSQPPPQPGCEDLCHIAFNQALADCGAQGNEAGDPNDAGDAACVEAARQALEACLSQCPAPPPTPTCEERCKTLEEEVLKKCETLATEAERARCLEEVDQIRQRCLANCVEPPPPTPQTCEEQCLLRIQEMKKRCETLADQDPEARASCEAEVERMIQSCLELCQQPPPPVEPGCEDSCRRQAEETLRGCETQNVSPDECKARYEDTLRACLAEQCPTQPPPETTCDEKCKSYAREVFDACMRNPGAADGTAGNGDPAEVDPAQCEQRAAEAFSACAAECSTNPPDEPPPALPCDEDCVSRSETIYKTCIEGAGANADPDGALAAECRQLADGLLALCMERCGSEEPCGRRCALAAQIVLDGCSLGGLPEAQCLGLANTVLEQCVGSCSPQVGCPDRCEERALSAVRECIARGGKEEGECSAIGDEVRAACLAACEGNAVPPCDVQCEEKADALAAALAAEGRPAEECAAARQRFLEECTRYHEENCVEELKADLTVFQSFLRGDANRDGDVNLTDAVAVLNWLFRAGSSPKCDDAADSNDDGKVDISDPITTLNALFLGGDPLPPPSDAEGQDSTSDLLTCAK